MREYQVRKINPVPGENGNLHLVQAKRMTVVEGCFVFYNDYVTIPVAAFSTSLYYVKGEGR